MQAPPAWLRIEEQATENFRLAEYVPAGQDKDDWNDRIFVEANALKPLPDPIVFLEALGAELKTSGIDSLLISGRSNRPVYLWVHDQTVEIRDASKLWGRDPIQTQQDIRKELADGEIKVGCIGLAGETKVRFAGVRSGLVQRRARRVLTSHPKSSSSQRGCSGRAVPTRSNGSRQVTRCSVRTPTRREQRS